MFWNTAPRVDKINDLLDKEETTLTDILEQDSISSSIRNSSNTRLFDFLSQPNNMEELLKWALTDEYKTHPKYTKLANAAVTIFSGSKPFQQKLLDNQTFLDKIKEFTTVKPPSSRSCGHYLRIVESIANGTKGAFLNELDGFSDFLINNITDMALKDLFVLMSTEFNQPFGFGPELLIKLVSTLNVENCLFIVSAIRDIISNNVDMSNFDSEEFFDHLFKFAIDQTEDHALLSTELFRLLNNFKDLESYKTVLQKYLQDYKYQINLSLPFQISVFQMINQPILDLFFDTKSCSLLVEAIYKSFINKTQDERQKLAKEENLFNKIMENFSKSITNGRMPDLAKQIYEDFKDSPETNSEFNEFYDKTVNEHLKVRQASYGGRVMNSDDDEEDEEEETISNNVLHKLSSSSTDSEEESDEMDDSLEEDEENAENEEKIDLTKAMKINNVNNDEKTEGTSDQQENEDTDDQQNEDTDDQQNEAPL